MQEWQECTDGASPALATSGFGPLGLGAEEAAALGGSAGRMVARWTLEERSLKRCAPHAPSSLPAVGCRWVCLRRLSCVAHSDAKLLASGAAPT